MRLILRSLVLSLPFLALPFRGVAQMHHVDRPAEVTRAVSVYEWIGPLDKPKAVRVVPVTVFIDAAYQDGGTYLSRPAPFALSAGNLYSVEKAGEPEGTLELKNARKLTTAGPDGGITGEGSWYGYGDFHLPTVETPKKLKPSRKVAKIDGGEEDDDGEPHFVAKRPAAGEQPDAPKMSRRDHPTSNDAEDPERPTLARREDVVEDEKKKKQKKEKPQGYVSGVGDLNDDPDRPTLSHGKKASDEPDMLTGLPVDMQQAVAVSDAGARPVHLFTREWSSPGDRDETLQALRALALPKIKAYLAENNLLAAKPVAEATPAVASQIASGPTLVASTAAPAKTGEATTTTADDSSDGAAPRLRRTPKGVNTSTQEAAPATSAPSTVTAPAVMPSASATSTTAAAKASPTSKAGVRTRSRSHAAHAPVAVPVAFVAEDLRGYNLSYGGLPTFVYTANIPATAKDGSSVLARVAVVAQRLPEGNLQISLFQLTDSAHLNRSPWMRFIDVVDADGSHRASLLFERRSLSTRDFALYRLVTAKAETSFSTAPLE